MKNIDQEERAKEKVRSELVETGVFTLRRCAICGGETEKVPSLYEVENGPWQGALVCETCLKSVDIDGRIIIRRTRSLQKAAEELEELISNAYDGRERRHIQMIRKVFRRTSEY